MVVHNLTISVDLAIEEEWLEFMKVEYIVQLKESPLIKDVRLYRVLVEEEEGASYASQLFFDSSHEMEQFLEVYLVKLNQQMGRKFIGKLASFETILNEVK